ncbi:MAG TPA: fused signal transduction protein/response regulator [Betaproteobacteria bacterium]|nr:fused signal transduction protein/response regulator [Betaproteobacteria bacterium]
MSESNAALLDKVEGKTGLAGSNKMEILLFTLGTGELFGINVFKVREVSQTPAITKTPNMPHGIEGVISLRGNIIPVISLAQFIQLEGAPDDTGQTMIVTEFSRHTQGFLVHDVDRIIRVDWDRVKPPQAMLAGNEGLITAITELPNGKLVSILDVEQILANAIGIEPVPDLPPIETESERMVFFADDSTIARKEIMMVLDKLGVKYQQSNDGLEAWDKLQALATRAQHDGLPLRDQLSIVLTDAEMPEMDGYVLTKKIKSDRKFEGIPVVMHSSLSSEANRIMGQQVGVDAYVAKFDPVVLAETLRPLLMR